MSQRKMFGEGDLKKALAAVDAKLGRGIRAYLIGGCAMTFMGRKAATKDIDIVFGSTEDAKDFVGAMLLSGFRHLRRITGPYSALGAFAIMEDTDEMGFDVYDRQVCRCLELSSGMKSRARLYQKLSNLEICLMAAEDIFLFKGITERDTDLDDMRILAEAGIDWKTVERECLSQKGSGRWAYMLGAKLVDLRAKSSIQAPIIKRLFDYADVDLLSYVFGQIMGKDERSFKDIFGAVKEKYNYSETWTRKQLELLIRKGIVGKKRVGRQDIFHMKKDR